MNYLSIFVCFICVLYVVVCYFCSYVMLRLLRVIWLLNRHVNKYEFSYLFFVCVMLLYDLPLYSNIN